MSNKCYKVVLNGEGHFLITDEPMWKTEEKGDTKPAIAIPYEVLATPGKLEREDKENQKPITQWAFQKIATYLREDVHNNPTVECPIKWNRDTTDHFRVFGMEAAKLEALLPKRDYEVKVSTETCGKHATLYISSEELTKTLSAYSMEKWEEMKQPAAMVLGRLATYSHRIDKQPLRAWIAKAAAENEAVTTRKQVFVNVWGASKAHMTALEAFEYVKRLTTARNNFIFKVRSWDNCERLFMDTVRLDAIKNPSLL